MSQKILACDSEVSQKILECDSEVLSVDLALTRDDKGRQTWIDW